MAVFPPKRDLITQIVAVAALTVYDFPKQPLFDHVEHHHFIPAIAAVFQHHHRGACPLKGFYQCVTFGDVVGAAYLDGRVLARFHGIHGVGETVVPAGHNDHGVQVRLSQHGMIIGVPGRGWTALFLQQFGGSIQLFKAEIADGCDLQIGHLGKQASNTP